jgi:hypothetical protein
VKTRQSVISAICQQRAVKTFALHRLGQTGLASIYTKKQGVQLWGVLLYVCQSFFDFLPKSAWWRHKAGRFIALNQGECFGMDRDDFTGARG